MPDAAQRDAKAEGETPPKRSLKVVLLIVGLMVAEAIAVGAILGLAGPSRSQADVQQEQLKAIEAEQTREILIAEEKFQNLQTGRVWLWDTAIYAQVKNKNAERVERILERRNAEIKQGISQIISRAQHAQLKEPERQTLNQQLSRYLRELLGEDSDGNGLVERVLIPKCRGFPAD